MCKRINLKNVRHYKINTNENRRIEFSYRNVFKSKTRRKATSHNVLFEKVIVNRTELRVYDVHDKELLVIVAALKN